MVMTGNMMYTILRDLGTYYDSDYIVSWLEEDFKKIVRTLFDLDKYTDFDYATGATKIVLTNLFDDCVIKFPCRGVYERVVHCDDEDGDEEDFYNFERYTGAESSNEREKDNYCEAEVEKVEDIPDEFKVFFALTEKIEPYEDVFYYKQERCVPYADSEKTSSTKVSEDIRNENEDFEEDWLAIAEETYGTDLTLDFLIWLNANSDITDLHRNNYGYSCKDGRPVIIDWGGYQS